MLAPQPYQALEPAVFDCRAGLRTGTVTTRQAEALMYAFHNIPSSLEQWEACDLSQLTAELRGYDSVWPGGHLLRVFEDGDAVALNSDLYE